MINVFANLDMAGIMMDGVAILCAILMNFGLVQNVLVKAREPK